MFRCFVCLFSGWVWSWLVWLVVLLVWLVWGDVIGVGVG